MGEAVQRAFTAKEGKPSLIRYADDFVVLHPTRAGVEKARQVIDVWLRDMGLELKPSKTRITHPLGTAQESGGFDFLGFNVRQYRVGRTHTAKNQHGTPLGFKTLTKPSNEAVKRHLAALGQIVRDSRNKPQEALITALNPVITGWANYHRAGVAKEIFSHCDHWLYVMLRRWARSRHPNKQAKWVTHKYWAVDQGGGWTFRTQDGVVLKAHAATPIRRHKKVKGTASPYDGNLVYWAQRLKDHPLTNNRTGYLLKWQRGRCASCGLYFRLGDVLEIDHIIPERLGGDDRLTNLQLLHRHCHDQKTAHDGSYQARGGQGIHDKDHLDEEPG